MLLTNCQQVAQALGEPLERISVAMVLRASYHYGQAVQRSGWHPDTQLRQIAFEKGLKKVETPPDTRRFRGGKKRCREAATAPQLEHRAGIDFIESKATKLIILYTPRQGLRGLLG